MYIIIHSSAVDIDVKRGLREALRVRDEIRLVRNYVPKERVFDVVTPACDLPPTLPPPSEDLTLYLLGAWGETCVYCVRADLVDLGYNVKSYPGGILG
ncbi:MAG: hypothetical protein GW780_01590 [Candidatus Aenigmarchaeota archaeon]|nr:hypothetical protein [Candidatus Aenigmarchaeota archaeon]